MSILQIIGLAFVIIIGLCAVLCYATTWAEPREDDVSHEQDGLIPKIEVERL